MQAVARQKPELMQVQARQMSAVQTPPPWNPALALALLSPAHQSREPPRLPAPRGLLQALLLVTSLQVQVQTLLLVLARLLPRVELEGTMLLSSWVLDQVW